VLAISAPDGAFPLAGVPAGTRLVSCDERWTTVAAAVVAGSAPIVVVAPRVAVTGTVIDVDGRSVAGAMLSIAIASSPDGDVGAGGVQWLAFSADDGTFTFAEAPGVATARLTTQHAGHRADERALPVANALGLVVTLAAEPSPPPLCGTVHGPDGAPFAGARVRMGEAVVESAADGTFTLSPPSLLPGDPRVFVVANGCAPVALADPRPADGREAPPLVVQLQPAVTIAGRIVDAGGRPLPQWTVTIDDPTPRDPNCAAAASIEGELGPVRAVTDADGQFRIGGVFARPYTIEAWGERGERGLRATVAPADGVVTLVARERGAATLRGVVVDAAGHPVAGALVGEERPGCAAVGALAMRFDHRATTAADGTFELPRRGALLHLIVDGASIVPCRVALPDASDAPLRLQVDRRRDVHLTANTADRSYAFESLTTEGSASVAREASPGTFLLPSSANVLVVLRHGGAAGTLALPPNGAPLEVRVAAPAR